MSDWDQTGADPIGGDAYASWDAAYVLGALAPSERRAYEEHLAGCRGCQQAVAQIAGLPGLLAQVTPEEAADLATDFPDRVPPAPPALLPGLLDRARRRRRTATLLVGAAALLLVLGTLGVLAGRGLGPFDGQDEPYRVAFSPLRPSAITAVADVMPQADGTQFQVECQYGESNAPTPGGAYATYEIWVTDRAGGEQMAKSWPAKPNWKMRPQAFSPLPESRIDHLEIRAADGEALLWAELR